MSHSFYKRVLQREERWLEEEAREARDPRLGQESPSKHRYVKDANMSCSAIGGRPALLAANPVCMLSPVASVDRSPQGNRYIDSLKSPSRRRSGSQSPSRRRCGSPAQEQQFQSRIGRCKSRRTRLARTPNPAPRASVDDPQLVGN